MRFSRFLKWMVLAAWLAGVAVFADDAGMDANPTPAVPPTDTPERASLLNDAFDALVEDQGRWAFTETRRNIHDGKERGESVARFDPSVTYAEQHKPIKIRGKAPTEKQLKEAAERGERAARRRAERQQKNPPAASEEKTKTHRGAEVQLYINGQKIVPEIDRATVLQEDETSVTYGVPLRAEGSGDAREVLGKFSLAARVGKTSRQFEHATIRQRAPMRVKLIAKVTDTVLEFEFGRPDPRYPSVVTRIVAQGHVRILFGKDRAMQSEVVRTEFKHVTPYDERFGVKMGATRTIEF